MLQRIERPVTGISFRRTKCTIEILITISSHSLWGFSSPTQTTSYRGVIVWAPHKQRTGAGVPWMAA